MGAMIVRGLVVVSVVLFSSAVGAELTDKEKQERRGEIDVQISELYEVSPAARSHIKSAAGYAVFSNFGMKILFAGGGSGKGLALNNRTGERTYMKMLEVQAVLGLAPKSSN